MGSRYKQRWFRREKGIIRFWSATYDRHFWIKTIKDIWVNSDYPHKATTFKRYKVISPAVYDFWWFFNIEKSTTLNKLRYSLIYHSIKLSSSKNEISIKNNRRRTYWFSLNSKSFRFINFEEISYWGNKVRAWKRS